MELQDFLTEHAKDAYILITTLTAFIGLFSTYRQWSKSLSLKRANYVYELCNQINTNKQIRDVLYLIDYGIVWYTSNFHSSGVNEDNDDKPSIEEKIDYTLTYFSYICYLLQKQIILDQDFVFFKYDTHRICTNPQVINYLYNIHHFAAKSKVPCSFHYLIEYARNHQLIDSDFFDKESYKTGKYHVYLYI